MEIASTPFHLSDNFISQFKGKQPNWGPLGLVVYKRTYSRSLSGGRQEEFWQTLERVVNGCYTIQKRHCDSYSLPWNPQKSQNSAQKMFRKMWEFKMLPPGRGLWMMGAPYIIERNTSIPLFSCAFHSTQDIAIDFAEPFCFMMDTMMLGVGCGGDTLGAGTVKIRKPKVGNYTHQVPDSREGWVELLRLVLQSYVGQELLPAETDYSLIRPAGTPIKSFGGTAPGPEPLKTLIEDVHKVLSQLIDLPITSTAIVDLFNIVGKAVVSGNIRRSAEILLGDPTDTEFLSLKDPEKFGAELKDRRWTSNNSIKAMVGQDYQGVAELTIQNGEPGYFWLQNARDFGRMSDPRDFGDARILGCNPCSEIPLESAELCNLTECFPGNHDSLEEFEDTLKFAYLYAKTVTLLPTHLPKTNAVQLRNRRLGISMSGITQAMQRHGTREFLRWCDKGYKHLKELDKIYSQWLCVQTSIRLTAIKPSGTVSLLPGVTPGVHFPHSQYYIRNIRMDKDSALAAALAEAGYPVTGDGDNKTSVVVSFPIKEELFDRCKKDVTMWEQLELAAQMQAYWADNMVSCTVTFRPEEAKDIARALELYETRLKSISFLPLEDHGYDNAPYVEISKEEYERMVSKIGKLKLPKNAMTHDREDKYCSGTSCTVD